MAQHRTKKEKASAHIHRLETHKKYSLSEIEVDGIKKKFETSQNLVNKPASPVQAQTQYIRQDLLRTAISFGIILVLLGIGFTYLR